MVSFAAVPVNDSLLLSDVYQLRQVSTTAKLLYPSKFDHAPKDIALFGGIDYSLNEDDLLAEVGKVKIENNFSRSLPADLTRGVEKWQYLPGTLQEVTNIANAAREKKIQTMLFTRAQAVEERFKSFAGNKSPSIIHIATHGFYFDQEQQDSIQAKNKVYRQSDNPLNRSGLLFAGGNVSWNSNSTSGKIDDGILTAYEATYVTLNNTQLVTLSACETGRGEVKGSEGVYGLQRAFKAAGSEYVMMSLWKVPDRETSEFMQLFYNNYFSGVDIPVAFQTAQETMKNKCRSEPFKWAAFVLLR
jgi:CHAT domain-containing protein